MRIRHVSGAFSLFLFFCLSAQAEIDPLQIWTASGGEARLELRADYLPDFGLEIIHEGRAADQVVEIRRGFTESDHLIIEAPYGNFEGFVGGEIRLDTGWILRYEGREVRLDGLTLTPAIDPNNGHPSLEARDAAGRHLLTFHHIHILAEHERDLLTLHNMDFSARPALAELLGMPALDDLVLGVAWLDLPMRVPAGADVSGRGPSCSGRPFWPQEFQTHGETIDVGLIGMDFIQAQGTDSGTGRLKVAPSATLKNLSLGDVPWIPKFGSLGSYPHSPPDQHPFLVFNMYRIVDGRIQQLGASGVKHAFLTLNNNCDVNCGSGNVLWPGCEDVYSTSNNDSNFNMGPREDIEASIGYFDSCNSFFSPGAGCSQTQNSTSFQNRLMIDPGLFQTPGAEYFFDAWYVIQYDTNIWNSMGYRPIVPTPGGSNGWTFPSSPFHVGQTVDNWVDPDTTDPNEGHTTIVVPSATPGEPYPDNMPQGHIKVLVTVTEPQADRYRYNYAVQNFDFERGIEAFRVPISESATVFEAFFGGVDGEPGDDWTITVEDGFVNFEAPENNPLGWFRLFNFEIETDLPPVQSKVTLDLGGDAVVPAIDAGILGPIALPDDISLEPAFPGVPNFNFPVALRHAGDGSGRKFIVERDGFIRIIDAQGDLLQDPFLDISSQVDTFFEGGLLGLAFHPDFTANDKFYVYFTASGSPLTTTIAEFEVDSGDPNQADPSSQSTVLLLAQPAGNHNGGDIHFGPDGYLYIGLGDGGPSSHGQNLNTLLGSMLRIDIDGDDFPGDPDRNYAIPADNPFVGVTGEDEIWAYGLRNPYRWSFDRGTGDLWIGDVGQNTWEEIDLEPAGDDGGNNYGWNVCEGNWQTGSTTNPCNLAGHTPPVLEYLSTGSHCSVTGGYRYRGPFPSLEGFYAYGDYCSGQVWLAQETGGDWFTDPFDNVGFGIVGFGEDEAGHLYLLRSNGEILRFEGDEGAVPELALTPAALNFGSVQVGQQADLDVELENTGTATLEVSALVLPGAPFSVDTGDCGGTAFDLEPEEICTLTVTFAPGAEGGFADELVIESNAGSSPDTVDLSGTGTQLPGELEVDPLSLDFGDVPVGGNSDMPVTVSNVAQAGAADLELTQIEIIAGTEVFAINAGGSDCGATLAAQTSCTVLVRFEPADEENYAGVLRVTADGATVNVSLEGTGIGDDPEPALSLSTDSLDFGSVEVGTQSTPLDVVLTSTGTGTLDVSGLAGPGALFSVDASDCGGTPFSLAPSEDCVLSVTFLPTFEGEVSDEVAIESNADSSPDVIELTGTGFEEQAPGELEVDPGSVDFGDVTIGDTGTAFVTLSNVAPEGSAALSLGTPSIITGGDDFEIAGDDCGATLEAQASCEVEIHFSPSEEIAYAGVLRIVTDVATVNVTLAGSGGGADPTIFEDRFEELALLLRGVLIGW